MRGVHYCHDASSAGGNPTKAVGNMFQSLPAFTSLCGLAPGHCLFYQGLKRPLGPFFTLEYGWLAKNVGSCRALVRRDCRRSEVFLVQPEFLYGYIPKAVPLPILGAGYLCSPCWDLPARSFPVCIAPKSALLLMRNLMSLL